MITAKQFSKNSQDRGVSPLRSSNKNSPAKKSASINRKKSWASSQKSTNARQSRQSNRTRGADNSTENNQKAILKQIELNNRQSSSDNNTRTKLFE